MSPDNGASEPLTHTSSLGAISGKCLLRVFLCWNAAKTAFLAVIRLQEEWLLPPEIQEWCGKECECLDELNRAGTGLSITSCLLRCSILRRLYPD